MADCLAYYNDSDPYCAAWLRRLVAESLIPWGAVDSRPIQEVRPEDVEDYTQVHLFAGLGGWAWAARLAGWPSDRPIWTGSCPCQPFSVAGKRHGVADERHLWPHFFRLIRACRPPVVMGEQVSGAAGYGWLDGVRSDLEAEDYACRAVDIPACAVNAPHRRNRIYWVAHSPQQPKREPQHPVSPKSRRDTRTDAGGGGARSGGVDDTQRLGRERREGSEDWCHDDRQNAGRLKSHNGPFSADQTGFWDSWELAGPDPQGKYRRVKPGVRLLASGVPARVAKLRALGNAIVPQLAAEVIRAWMETHA